MEVAGNGVGPFHLGPLTSTPIESSTSSVPTRADSLSSENSDSSGEDWLIKVRCPGARHRYSKRAHAKKSISSRSTKTETSSILDKKDDFTEKTELTPTTSYQDYTRVPRQESADLEWLIRLRCPKAQMEQLMPDLKQSFPGITSFLSKSQSKVGGRSQSEKTKTSESWLTQKHLSIAQALVNESQDVIGPIQLLLERESCFIREVDRYLKHNDFLALRRREMLYKKWFESVSRPLLQKIQDKVDNQSSKEIEERKRKQLSLYLNYCNEKASVPPLHDPLLKEIEGRFIEASIMQQCETESLPNEEEKAFLLYALQLSTGKLYSSKDIHELHKTELPPLPLGRQLMNPAEWLKIPFQYMESDVRKKSRQKMSTTRNQNTMDFKSWGDPSWPPLKKRFPSVRKPEFTQMASLLSKQIFTGSSVSKRKIKFASY